MRRKLKAIVASVILAGLALPSTALSRQVEDWSYERLLKEADIVVIARAVASEPAKDKWSEAFFEGDRFEGRETTFEVCAALKGAAPDSLKLLHFRYKPGAKRFNDGPGFVSLLNKGESLEVTVVKQGGGLKELAQLRQDVAADSPGCLLFLKKRDDGRFEAVSGQIDPDASVWALVNAIRR